MTYEMLEDDPEQGQTSTSISGFVISDDGHVQISAYCDDRTTLKLGYDIIQSVQLNEPPSNIEH